MTQNPGFLLTVLAFALVLGPLVFVHELGHYFVGRWLGVKAEAFSVGFGRELFGITDKRGTRWKFGWIPLGGYVRFAGDMNPASQPDAQWLELPAAERAQTFQAKLVWQRALIVAAGPATNFLFAILIFSAFAMAYGVNRTPAGVGAVESGSPAAAAGLAPGDRILAMDGRQMDDFSDLVDFTILRPGETVTMTWRHDGTVRNGTLTLDTLHERDRFGNEFRRGRLGIAAPSMVYERVGVLEAPLAGFDMTVDTLQTMLDGLGQIITGRRSVDELGGPLRIAKVSGEQLSLGLPALINLIAFISINLGFINLLPVPMLDGGHLFFYAVEAVRRRPVEPQVMEWAYRGGLAAILALFLLVTFNDLGAFGVWHGLAGLIG